MAAFYAGLESVARYVAEKEIERPGRHKQAFACLSPRVLYRQRPDDPRYSTLSSPAGAAAVDGTLGCVILVSPVIDPLGLSV